jgi:FO synthase
MNELLITPLSELMQNAAKLRDAGWGKHVSYSRKVFIPLTELCRDVCHYCTYAKTPKRLDNIYLSPEQVLAIARAGQAQGCKEALFTLGDKPELRYRAAREALDALGYASTIDYVGAMAKLVLEETGLLPHLNPGVMSFAEYTRLREFAPSMGIMLESSSSRLSERDMPHFGSPDKDPAVRLASIRDAGRAKVPLTTGILIGIGETRAERLQSLQDIKDIHAEFGHIQEIIVQNFVPKPDTKMKNAAAPDFTELLWTIAVTRNLFGPAMSIQAPPNLNEGRLPELIAAGINDWGGVSPVTPDHVNPESPWPELQLLEAETGAAGAILTERLTAYPYYIEHRDTWLHPNTAKHVLKLADSSGLARTDTWCTGDHTTRVPELATKRGNGGLGTTLDKAIAGDTLSQDEIVQLFNARGDDIHQVVSAADALRREVSGDVIRYVVNRNINYTNVCTYKCKFCAFSKGKTSENLRGQPYLIDLEEIARRTEEAWQRGATEICLQGGIHPAFTGQTYLDICATVKEAAPDIHVHAFSPLEVTHGAQSSGLSIEAFLRELKAAGLGTLPGTAAEILDDEIRDIICPDKINTAEWLNVIGTAHQVGLQTTSTIMFGHLETPRHWANHLLELRRQQQATGGITEFVPLPFVHMEAPMYIRGMARKGPTWREALLMHAVSRLVLNPLIPNIQVSWTKMGPEGAAAALNAGANDLGGTLMNESISRAAGSAHGEEFAPEQMDALIHSINRTPCHRTTLYGEVPEQRIAASYNAAPITDVVNKHAREYARKLPRAS